MAFAPIVQRKDIANEVIRQLKEQTLFASELKYVCGEHSGVIGRVDERNEKAVIITDANGENWNRRLIEQGQSIYLPEYVSLVGEVTVLEYMDEKIQIANRNALRGRNGFWSTKRVAENSGLTDEYFRCHARSGQLQSLADTYGGIKIRKYGNDSMCLGMIGVESSHPNSEYEKIVLFDLQTGAYIGDGEDVPNGTEHSLSFKLGYGWSKFYVDENATCIAEFPWEGCDVNYFAQPKLQTVYSWIRY